MIVLLSLLINTAIADDVFLRYNIHAVAPYPDVSSLSIGRINRHKVLASKYEGGIILDRRVPNKVAFGSASIGVQPEWGPFSLYFFQGVALLSGTDKFLSTPYQFMEEAGLQWRGKDGTFIGLGLRHISNGGLRLPNIGKDFIGLSAGFRL